VSHLIFRVTSFEIVAPYTLRVGFDDGVERTIWFRPVLAGELFGPLRDLSLFNQVQIDPEVHTLVWPNGADFDPATLHDWPEYVQALTARPDSGSWRPPVPAPETCSIDRLYRDKLEVCTRYSSVLL
jgi:hypothetical protein